MMRTPTVAVVGVSLPRRPRSLCAEPKAQPGRQRSSPPRVDPGFGPVFCHSLPPSSLQPGQPSWVAAVEVHHVFRPVLPFWCSTDVDPAIMSDGDDGASVDVDCCGQGLHGLETLRQRSTHRPAAMCSRMLASHSLRSHHSRS